MAPANDSSTVSAPAPASARLPAGAGGSGAADEPAAGADRRAGRQPTSDERLRRDEHLRRLHEATRRRGVNKVVYWLTRVVLQPLIHAWFRLERIGHRHIPDGPVILAANHRSFLDPFVIGCCLRRPVYFVAKRELFERRFWGRYLNWLGAFPVRRGESDEDAVETALALLRRGQAVVIFPEGTRIRHGSLGKPRRGVGRLALESGAPVVPIAVTGTERARRGLLVRPVKVRVRCGAPLRFPRVERPSPALARAVLERIWPHIQVQWEWLGGDPPLRSAMVLGDGAKAEALAALLGQAGLNVARGPQVEPEDRTTRGRAVARAVARAGSRLRGRTLEPSGSPDLLVLAASAQALPQLTAEAAQVVDERTLVLVAAKGLVPPLGTTPAAYVSERLRARAVVALGGPVRADDIAAGEACAVVAATDPGARARVAQALRSGGLEVEESSDVVGVELAGCANGAAALAALAVGDERVALAGAAAARVFEEVERLGRQLGARPDTFAGLAGAGELVSAVLSRPTADGCEQPEDAENTCSRGAAGAHQFPAGALEAIALLEGRMRRAGVDAPVTRSLRALLEGRIDRARWLERVRRPRPTQRAA